MNPKNTWFLVFLTAALFAFIFFFERHIRPPKNEILRVLPRLNVAAVSAVEIHLSGQPQFRVERTNGGWLITEPLVYPAQTSAVEYLLAAAADLSPRTHLSAEVLKGRLTVNEEYGFESPQATIVFQQGSERRQLKLGYFTAPGDNIYAQVVGLEGVDIIDADFFKKIVPHHVNQWRDTSFINLNDADFDRVTVATPQPASPFELDRDHATGVWQMQKPVVTRADYPKINHLLKGLEETKVVVFQTDNPQADLDFYGLQPPSLEMKFDHGTNHVLGIQFGKSPTNTGAEGFVYAHIIGKSSIVVVPRTAIAPWFNGYEEFRDLHLVRLTNGQPGAIQVFALDDFMVRRETNNLWTVTEPSRFPADTNAMRQFLTTLSNLEVVRVNHAVAVNDVALPDTDFPLYGLTKPSRRYLLAKALPDGAAPSSNSILAELDFGSVKDGRVFVRRADRPEETSVYAIKLEDFQALPASSLQMRDHRIWNFSEDDVTRITIRKNGQSNTLVHKGPNQWSVAEGSQGVINDLQIEVGAQELGFLTAENWVQRGDQDREKFGFTPQSPRLTVEVKIDSQPKTLFVDFGGVSPHGLRYGAALMPDGQNWIFEFSSVAIDRFVTYFDLKEIASP